MNLAVEVALAEVYTPEGVDIWLNSRNRMLDNERPVDLLRTPEGEERVLQLVESLAHGAF